MATFIFLKIIYIHKMKKIFLFLSLFSTISLFGQSFFNEKVIQTIEIKFAFADWDAQMDAAALKASDPFTIAVWCKINGEQFDSVGVKFKGNSSYKANNKKNPLHIELNNIKKNQTYKGLSDVKLSNVFADATYIREQLSYKLLRQYMDAPRCNQAKVYINGVYYGLMTNAEPINSVFLNNSFNEKNGILVKCNPVGGAGPGGGTLPNLAFLGTDSTKYQKSYEIKSDYGWKDLVSLCDTLTNKVNSVGKVLDIDRSLWMLAFNSVFANYDSYTGSFAQNYYLYKDETKRFLPIVWDLNMSFGGFPGGIGGGGTSNVATTDAFAGSTNAARPLIKQLLANARYKKMYVAKMRTMLNENFVNGNYLTEAAALQGIIDSVVKNDVNTFYPYAQFQTSLTVAATGTGIGGNAPAIKPLMETRLAYINGLADFKAIPPAITAIVTTSNAKVGEKMTITANLNNSTTEAFLNYRFEKRGIFTSIKMLDDGQHGDGTANDGVWGASFTMSETKADYYIYAENATAGMFAPERAEHEFFEAKAIVPSSGVKIKKGELVINEIVASNLTIAKDENNQYEDYLELKNNTNKAIDLSGLFLSDDYVNPYKWTFKAGSTIAPNGYLIVWADQDKTQGTYHADFKLSNNGEQVILLNADSTVVDSLTFPKLKDDVSYSRCPDATGTDFKKVVPTFNAANTCIKVGVEDLDGSLILNVYPNPSRSEVTIDLGNTTSAQPLVIYNYIGQRVFQSTFQSNLTISVETWQPGLYLVQCGRSVVKLVVE